MPGVFSFYWPKGIGNEVRELHSGIASYVRPADKPVLKFHSLPPAFYKQPLADMKSAEQITGPSREPMLTALCERITGLARKRGWDGMGARAITSAVCEEAITFLQFAGSRRLPEPSSVSPSARGAVALEWRDGRSIFMIEVRPSEDDKYYFQGVSDRIGFQRGRQSRNQLVMMVRKFVYPETALE